MPQVTIPEETYQRLAERAVRANVTVDDLLTPVLDELSRSGSAHLPPTAITHEEWKRRWEEWKQIVQSRADRYPPGFRVDDSRESIYREREDAQLPPDLRTGVVPPPPEPSPPLTGAAWWAVLEAWERDAAARAAMYPPGFQLDDSRDAIYRERLDAQL